MTAGDAGHSLSILAAAREAGDAAALVVGARTYTFAALAGIVRPRIDEVARRARAGVPYPLVGSGTLDTLVTLYALLEARIPALLVHPQATEVEHMRLLAAAAQSGGLPHPDAAAILYTSGTTGEPRGAVLTRSALCAAAAASAANIGWEGDDRWLLCMPLARIGGLSIVTRSLASRRCVVLEPAFDAALYPRWIEQHRVTLASVVPTMLTRVLDAHPDWVPPAHLRAVLVGGAAASAALLRRAGERRLPIVVTYGLTEACSHVTTTPYAARFEPAKHGAGRPLPGIDVRVRDGHIEVRGAVLMAGYWNEAPLEPGAWFDTGDMGEFDAAGCLHVHARRTDLIVTGGENVYPAEVERVLETFPGIVAAGVFGVPDEAWGQTVAAALVAGKPPPDAALADFCRRELAPHKRPRQVCYVERLPEAASGKLDRPGLAELARELRPLMQPHRA